MDAPETLQQAIAFFSDPQRAFEAATEFRWPDGKVTCPRCGEAKHSFVKTRRLWFCYACKKQFTAKVGTIMEDSPIGLDKWMIGIWMLANCKNGISSYELAKVLGIRQNSAWFLLHRIREAMKQDKDFKLGGPEGGAVESDEAFIGGEPKNRHIKERIARMRHIRQGPFKEKTAVVGLLDRDARKVRTYVFPKIGRETLQNVILDNVQKNGHVYTDSATGYRSLDSLGYVHGAVNHMKEYVRGQVHVNGMENFWSLLKRSLRGTYVAVEPFHLDAYVDEQVFRYNNRATKENKLTDTDRFALVMSKVAGKRLTYAQLTGKDSNEPHHPEAGAGQEEPF